MISCKQEPFEITVKYAKRNVEFLELIGQAVPGAVKLHPPFVDCLILA